MRPTLPMAVIEEGYWDSGDPGWDDGSPTCTWGRLGSVGAPSATSSGPARPGKGACRFVPLMDLLAFPCKCGGASTKSSGSFPSAAHCARMGQEVEVNSGAGTGAGASPGSAIVTADTWHMSKRHNEGRAHHCQPEGPLEGGSSTRVG